MIYLDCTKIGKTGIGRYIQQLVKGLTDVFDFFVGDRTKLCELVADEKIISVDEFNRNVKLHLSESDVIHFPGNTMKALNGIEKINCKKIVTIHDTTPLIINVYSKKKTETWRQEAAKAIECADLIITDSNNSRQDLIKYFEVEIERIKVVYLYASSFFGAINQEKKMLIKHKYNVSENSQVYFVSGTMAKNKNIYRELIAIRLSKRYKKCTVLITNKSKKIKLLFAILGMKKNLRLLGTVSDEELNEIYNIADVFLYCSLYEGFGLPPLEAMRCHTSVIASNLSCIPEILGETVCYVNPYSIKEIKNAINILSDSSSKNKELSNKGFEHSEKYSMKKFVEDTKNAILSI
ncbi:glycosyltransferase family 1 protein [Sporolactobacillus sp. STCC-11]|uniref:glycosyltransferase family 4 protein n=1 Tax=Sporolactobacillus caesalpiniae TaxID=3230362 RepID=UPI0033911E1D